MRLALLLPCLLLAACSAETPPAAEAPAEEHTELRDSIQAPIDKAKAVDEVQKKAAEDERKAIDDSGA